MITLTHIKPATLITAVLLLIIAIAHLLRLLYQTNVTVSSVAIPEWISIPTIVVTAGLAAWLVQENKK